MRSVWWGLKRVVCALFGHDWTAVWHGVDSFEREGIDCRRCRHAGVRYVLGKKTTLVHNARNDT